MRVGCPKLPNWLVTLLMVLALWALADVAIVLLIAPGWPRTTRGWLLLLAAGPPLYVAGEWVSGRLFDAKVGYRISRARFSLARIFVALIVMLAAFTPLAWWLLRHGP